MEIRPFTFFDLHDGQALATVSAECGQIVIRPLGGAGTPHAFALRVLVARRAADRPQWSSWRREFPALRPLLLLLDGLDHDEPAMWSRLRDWFDTTTGDEPPVAAYLRRRLAATLFSAKEDEAPPIADRTLASRTALEETVRSALKIVADEDAPLAHAAA